MATSKAGHAYKHAQRGLGCACGCARHRRNNRLGARQSGASARALEHWRFHQATALPSTSPPTDPAARPRRNSGQPLRLPPTAKARRPRAGAPPPPPPPPPPQPLLPRRPHADGTFPPPRADTAARCRRRRAAGESSQPPCGPRPWRHAATPSRRFILSSPPAAGRTCIDPGEYSECLRSGLWCRGKASAGER